MKLKLKLGKIMKQFAYALSMADLFGVLMVTFLFSLGVVTPLVNQEVTTFIESTKAKPKENANVTNNQEVARLNAIYKQNGQYQLEFHYKYNGKEIRQSFSHLDGIKVFLQQHRPEVLEVKMDGRIKSAVLQQIILDTSELEITMVQVNDSL